MNRIMTLEEFSEYVRDGVKAGLPHELAKAKVTIEYEKDGYSKIQIDRPWSNLQIQYRLTLDYRDYLSGKCTPEFSIANILNSPNLYHVPLDFCNMDVSDFENVKSRIVSRFVSSEPQQAELLKDRPVKYLEDIPVAMVWEFHSTDLYDNDEIARMPVTWEILDTWKISIDELEQLAQKNTPILRPAQVKYMSQVFQEKGVEKENCECEDFIDFVVVTNQDERDGSITIAYPDVREKLIEMLGNDIYIMPASIHECFAMSKRDIDLQALYYLVRDMNKTQIDVREFLANDVWEYSSDGHLVSAIHNQKKEPIDENSTFI